MADGMLSLAWNNHSSTFCHMLSNLREMEKYTDATVACEGKFYGVHKLVLASCSDYFFKMFEETPCKHPVVVLKDIHGKEIEALLSYMYDGVVSVAQSDLARLISAAEVLQIKGLAVPDEPPKSRKKVPHSRSSSDDRTSPQAKRVRREESNPSSNTRSKDKSLSGGSEQVESRNGVNRIESAAKEIECHKEAVVIEESDIRRRSREETEMKSDDPEIETISDESTIKEEVSIESDDLPETPFEFASANLDVDIESSSGIKDLVNLEIPVSFGSMLDPYDSQAGPSGLQWSNAQGDMSNHRYSGNTSPVAGPSGLQSQQDRSMKDQVSSKKNRSSRRASSAMDVWRCSFCPYTASSDDDLMEHISTHSGSFIEVRQHKGKKKFGCKICSYVNHTEYGVRVHLRSHTGEKPFACPLCPSRFSQKCHLKCHLVRHTGEKPFECTFCLARFNRKSSLHRHILAHNT